MIDSSLIWIIAIGVGSGLIYAWLIYTIGSLFFLILKKLAEMARDRYKKYKDEKSREFDSNLVQHFRRELALIGEEQETIDGLVKIAKAFSEMGHSGGSASVAIPMINRLLQYQNLMPLTDAKDEWTEVGYELWQNNRNSEMFSEDGGLTYHSVNDPDQVKQQALRTRDSYDN